jgi:hypothetical protein
MKITTAAPRAAGGFMGCRGNSARCEIDYHNIAEYNKKLIFTDI